MTYSVSTSGATKAEAIAQAAEQFTKIREHWPVHEADSVAVQNTVVDFVNMLPDDPDRTVSISVSGSINVAGPGSDVVTGASASINVYSNHKPLQS